MSQYITGYLLYMCELCGVKDTVVTDFCLI